MQITFPNNFGLSAITIPDTPNLQQPELCLHVTAEGLESFNKKFDNYYESLYKNYPELEQAKQETDNQGTKIFLREPCLVVSTLEQLILDNYSNADLKPLEEYIQKIEKQCDADFRFFDIEVPAIKEQRPTIQFKIKGNGRDAWFFYNSKDFLIKSTQCSYKYENDYFICTAKGKRSVCHFIDKMLQHQGEGYSQSLVAALTNYKQEIEKTLKFADVNQLPLRGLRLSDLTEVASPKSSTSDAFHVVKLFNDTAGTLYHVKMNPVKRKIVEYESAISWVYKALLLKNAAVTRCVYNEKGEKVASASEDVKNFLDLCNPKASSLFTKHGLIAGNLGRIQFVALAYRENDLHGANIGFDDDKQVVKIDHDRSLYNKLCIYFNRLPNVERYISRLNERVAPDKSFPISSSDILNMPKIKDAKPDKWLVDLTEVREDGSTFWDELATYKGYEYDVRISTVMVALLDKDFYEKIADAHFTSLKGHKIFMESVTEISEGYFELIIKTPELSQFVAETRGLPDQIVMEFTQYNKYCEQKGCEPLQMDITALQEKFQSLVSQCCDARKMRVFSL